MKKLILRAAFAATTLTALVQTAQADTWMDPETYYTYTYTVSGRTATLVNNVNPYTCAVFPKPVGKFSLPATFGDGAGAVSLRFIGDYALSDCPGLYEVNIPSGVRLIGERAFENCPNLLDVSLPRNMAGIGYAAFRNCPNLVGMDFPSFLVSIGAEAFSGCASLVSIVVPPSVESVGYDAFAYCPGLRDVTLPCASYDGNPFYQSENITNLTINAGAVSSEWALVIHQPHLQSVTIQEGVQTITATNAFDGCYALENVSIADSVTYLHCNAFNDSALWWEHYNNHPGEVFYVDGWACGFISTASIPNGELVFEPGTRGIAADAFASHEGFSTVTIPGSVKYICDRAFYDIYHIESVLMEEGVLGIGDYAFYYCYNMTNAPLPSTLIHIGEYAFDNCWGLTEAVIPGGVTHISEGAFAHCPGITNLVISYGVETIGSDAFVYCSGLTDVVIPDSVTSIGYCAFYGCENLTSVVIPPGVESIDARVFENCGSLCDITLPCGMDSSCYDNLLSSVSTITNLTVIAGANSTVWGPVFHGYAGLRGVTIAEGVTALSGSPFNECVNLARVSIADSVETFAYDTFHNTVLWNLHANGIFYVDGWACTFKTAPFATLGDVAFPPGTRGIAEDAFARYNGITGVTIPGSVRFICNSAFDECDDLLYARMGEGVLRIGERAFAMCRDMEELVLADSVTFIGDHAFDSCERVTELTIPQSLAHIGNSVFRRCQRIGDLTIPENVATIGNDAFTQCSALRNLVISQGVEDIGNGAFQACVSLRDVVLPGSVANIGNDAFKECADLRDVVIPGSVATIGDRAFMQCSGLTNAVISSGVKKIGVDAFDRCVGLTQITIPGSVTNLGECAFASCGSLMAVYFTGNAPEVVGDEIYASADLVTTYVFEDSKGWDGDPNSTILPFEWHDRPIAHTPGSVYDDAFTSHGVPYKWIRKHFPLDDPSDFESIADGLGANGYLVWESWIALLDPNDENSHFVVFITMDNGEPVITCDPYCPAKRAYTKLGRASLTTGEWGPMDENSRFFKMSVRLK